MIGIAASLFATTQRHTIYMHPRVHQASKHGHFPESSRKVAMPSWKWVGASAGPTCPIGNGGPPPRQFAVVSRQWAEGGQYGQYRRCDRNSTVPVQCQCSAGTVKSNRKNGSTAQYSPQYSHQYIRITTCSTAQYSQYNPPSAKMKKKYLSGLACLA